MDDIKALEARIVTALDRIRAGLTVRGDATGGADLTEQLEEERFAKAQLQERMSQLKVQQEGRIAELEARCGAQADQMADLDAELQQLRGSNADLTQVCAQLRATSSKSAVDPELINRALMAEVEGLTAQRSAEAAEVAAILSDLKPLLQREG